MLREERRRRRNDFLLTLWTDDPSLAAVADRAGVDRIGVDLEVHGKRARQGGLGTWISTHELDDLPPIRRRLTRSRLFARANPVSRETPDEVEALLSLGVEVIMLPMFRSAEELEQFAGVVGARATIVPLLETMDAVQDIKRITSVRAVRELHVGINDLALNCGMTSRFEVLDSEVVEHVSAHVHEAGWRFGVGGIGRVGDRTLPISPDLLYAQYARLGASGALISRTFFAGRHNSEVLLGEVGRSRSRMARWAWASPGELSRARDRFRDQLAGCTTW